MAGLFAVAAHFFGAENAFEAGQNFVGASQRYGLPEAREALAQMSPEEKRLFQDGYVARLIERLDATGDRRNALNQIAKSTEAKQEIRMVLGPQRALELEARLRVEGVVIGALTAAIASGGKHIDQNVARHVAKLLASNDPATLLRGMLIVTGNNRVMDALRATDQRIAQIGGQQSGTLAARPQHRPRPIRSRRKRPPPTDLNLSSE